MLDFRKGAHFGSLIFLVGSALYVCSAVLSFSKCLFFLYARPFTFYHQMMYRAYSARYTHKKVVLLIGLSAVKEAFDEKKIEDRYPGYQIVNLGVNASSGYAHSLNLITSLLRDASVRADYVILGLSPFSLTQGTLNLEETNVTDFMVWHTSQRFLEFETESARKVSRRRLVMNEVFPLASYSRQLGRLLRLGLFYLNQWTPQKFPIDNYENFYSELHRDLPEFLLAHREYSGSKKISSVHDFVTSALRLGHNLEDESSIVSMRAALTHLSSLTPPGTSHVGFILLPGHSVIRSDAVYERMDRKVLEILNDLYPNTPFIFDFRQVVPDTAFYDHSHVLSRGRALATEKLINEVLPKLLRN